MNGALGAESHAAAHPRRRLVRARSSQQRLPVVAALRYASALHPTMARVNKLLDLINLQELTEEWPESGSDPIAFAYSNLLKLLMIEIGENVQPSAAGLQNDIVP